LIAATVVEVERRRTKKRCGSLRVFSDHSSLPHAERLERLLAACARPLIAAAPRSARTAAEPAHRRAVRLDGGLGFKPVGNDGGELLVGKSVDDAVRRLRQLLALTLKDCLADELAHSLIDVRVLVLHRDEVG
jgi:hypothetical protein